MRLYIKKKCINMIKLLKDAHGEIKIYQNTKDFEKGFTVLEDCQNACLALGQTIEQNEMQNTDEIIELLEEYCEDIYQLSMTYKDVYYTKVYQKLDKLLGKVLYCIGHKLHTEYDIVFLPYKASMWDSLESIWVAAASDSDCHCHVIPIPYHDRMQNGDLGEYHYEGAEFPNYVPIEQYSNIDIETWKPDIIYIHNPYDDGNYVTSVLPNFYSSELKKHTDKLVYVPYYVAQEEDSDIFYQTKGVQYADIVILQSNSIRKQCINVYRKTTDTLATKATLNHKFLALGSPKFDKVIKLGDSDLEIPDEWKKFIGIDVKKRSYCTIRH